MHLPDRPVAVAIATRMRNSIHPAVVPVFGADIKLGLAAVTDITPTLAALAPLAVVVAAVAESDAVGVVTAEAGAADRL
jgi:hypothetical protein